MSDNEVLISVRNLYKIFGPDPKAALEMAKNGTDKATLLSETGHVLGLRNINVDMKAGEITVIMGLSGSGKSTLIRHLNRLIDPTDGEILVKGTDVMKLDEEGLRQTRRTGMSMVFQKFALLPHKTVLENACMARMVRGETEAEASVHGKKWLDRVGLSGFEGHYPNQLSGGMQQRVGLARALASDSEVMLMDEAFSALDPLIRTSMQDLLLELQTDLHKTIIFITHDLDEALKLADHLVILKDGMVVQQGEPQHILLNPNDPYIEDFVSDINRARVLRVRSIMAPLESGTVSENTVDHEETLEWVIDHAQGDITKDFTVTKDGQPVGLLHMKDLVKALVPHSSETAGDVR